MKKVSITSKGHYEWQWHQKHICGHVTYQSCLGGAKPIAEAAKMAKLDCPRCKLKKLLPEGELNHYEVKESASTVQVISKSGIHAELASREEAELVAYGLNNGVQKRHLATFSYAEIEKTSTEMQAN